MNEVYYKWLENYKGYEICEEEDFIHIKRHGIVLDTFLSTNPSITESFLEQKVREHAGNKSACRRI